LRLLAHSTCPQVIHLPKKLGSRAIHLLPPSSLARSLTHSLVRSCPLFRSHAIRTAHSHTIWTDTRTPTRALWHAHTLHLFSSLPVLFIYCLHLPAFHMASSTLRALGPLPFRTRIESAKLNDCSVQKAS
jgi:hypothetical protein